MVGWTLEESGAFRFRRSERFRRRRLDSDRGKFARLDRLDHSPEAGVVFERDLEEGRLDLGNGLMAFLVVANLQLCELIEHLLERKLHLHIIGGSNRAQENFRDLLVNRSQRNGGLSARHSSFNFGGFQEDPPGPIDAFDGLDVIPGNLGRDVGQRERDDTFNSGLERQCDRGRQVTRLSRGGRAPTKGNGARSRRRSGGKCG